jgi:hypothetical protein
MFRRLPDPKSAPASQKLSLFVDGIACEAHAGETVATVLLRLDPPFARENPVSGEARAPYCLMGVCFDCLVTVNEIPSQQACLTHVQAGMRIERRHAP